MDFISEVIIVLYEEGLAVEYTGVDLDLRDYIADSIQFINFIVDIEKRFEIEFPDEYLLYDSIASLHSFVELIKKCREKVFDEAHND